MPLVLQADAALHENFWLYTVVVDAQLSMEPGFCSCGDGAKPLLRMLGLLAVSVLGRNCPQDGATNEGKAVVHCGTTTALGASCGLRRHARW